MRRIAAVLGVLVILLGAKFYEVTPADCGYAGEETVYAQSLRYDFAGDETCAKAAIENLCGNVLWQEEWEDGLTVYYAYSGRIYRSVALSGQDINLMVAVRGGKVSIGSPMLEGSY